MTAAAAFSHCLSPAKTFSSFSPPPFPILLLLLLLLLLLSLPSVSRTNITGFSNVTVENAVLQVQGEYTSDAGGAWHAHKPCFFRIGTLVHWRFPTSDTEAVLSVASANPSQSGVALKLIAIAFDTG